MKKILAIIILFCTTQDNANAQISIPENGEAIKTENGILFFYDEPFNFSLNLIGSVDIDEYHKVIINNSTFGFTYGFSDKFGETEKEILLNFMRWEVNYLGKTIKGSVQTNNNFIKIDHYLINYWNYINPLLVDNKDVNEKSYFADFYRDGVVFRFSFVLTPKGVTVDKINSILTSCILGIHFYNEKIELKKLQQAIKEGKSHY